MNYVGWAIGLWLQVGTLLAGRWYAARVCLHLKVKVDEHAAQDLVFESEPSKPVIFRTLPCSPGTPPPPLLVSKERKALKVSDACCLPCLPPTQKVEHHS